MEHAMDTRLPKTASAAGAICCSITIFTHRWKEVRDFYVGILKGQVLHERDDRYCEMALGDLPLIICQAEHGEAISYFHLHFLMKSREPTLHELRRKGIIVTTVGPYTNFRDPEGRVIKLSEEGAVAT